MSSNLLARLAVAAVGIPVILWISYRGGWWLFGMVLFFAIAALVEFLVNEGSRPAHAVFWLALLTLLTTFWLILPPDCRLQQGWTAASAVPSALPLLAFFVVSTMSFAVGRKPAEDLFRKHARIWWGVAYVCLLYPFVLFVGSGHKTASGGDLLLFLFGLLWLADTAAMGVGKWLGRHKLAPSVSPNKTIEGFIGGLVGGLAVGVLMFFWKLADLGLGHVLALSLGCSLVGQLGDLVESMWKRSLGIKDSSAIIPGHGGILDRFDSLLFAAPFMYGYLQLFV